MLLLTSCHRHTLPEPVVAAPSIPATPYIPPLPPVKVNEPVLVAQIEQTPCFGSCPVYRARVYADGSVEWQGTQHVARIGSYRAQVSAAWIAGLLKSADDAGYFGMQTHFPANGRTLADIPSSLLCLQNTTRRQQHCITDNGDAPLALQRLEKRIVSLLDALDWQKAEKQ
jgi:hypothetical protein